MDPTTEAINKGLKDIGKGCVLIVIALIVGVIVFPFVDKEPEGLVSGTEIDSVLQELAGRNSPVVQKIKSLNPNSAYMVGKAEGSVAGAIFRSKLGPGEMAKGLSVKNDQFDLIEKLRETTQVDPQILMLYRKGWSDGWISAR